MSDKYLSIGTICQLKGQSSKIMITGFHDVIYNGNIKTYDYQGCIYPEGLLLHNKESYFNHEDIEQVIFNGYVGEEHLVLNDILNKTLNPVTSSSTAPVSDIKFDKNGVVVFSEGESINGDPDKIVDKSTFSDIKFDENGYVVSAVENEPVVNPFIPDYQLSPANEPKDKPDISIFKNLKFDENGYVISEDTISSPNDNSNQAPIELLNDEEVSTIKFDDQGLVISE